MNFAEKNPNLISEWHPSNALRPQDTSAHSHVEVKWICSKGHEWVDNVSHRSSGRGCPYCSGHRVCKDNCLATTYPHVAKDWHPTKNGRLTPYDVTGKCGKIVWWRCKAGHEFEAKILNRTIGHGKGNGCIYCLGRKATSDSNLLSDYPGIAKEWDYILNYPLRPENITSGSGKKVWWKCSSCNHEWQTSTGNRCNLKSNCPKCKMIILKDGVGCDSIVEAYYYLKYTREGREFLHHGKYGEGLGNCKYDFYFPKTNTYVEITSFCRGGGWAGMKWMTYLRKIVKKRKFVREVLGARFEFVQHQLTKRERELVSQNMAYSKRAPLKHQS